MNERIRELMLEVGFVGYGEDLGSYNIPVPAFNSRMEKFAELIVRECAEVCMKEIDTGWVKAPKSPWMAKQILEHFGME